MSDYEFSDSGITDGALKAKSHRLRVKAETSARFGEFANLRLVLASLSEANPVYDATVKQMGFDPLACD